MAAQEPSLKQPHRGEGRSIYIKLLHRAKEKPEMIRRRKDPKPRQMICTDVQGEESVPEKAFIRAWKRLAGGYEENLTIWNEALDGDMCLKYIEQRK